MVLLKWETKKLVFVTDQATNDYFFSGITMGISTMKVVPLPT
jgi:hypothetical protein